MPVEVGGARFEAPDVYAAAGCDHSGVVTSEGAYGAWGYGLYGKLGHNDQEDQLVPKEIEGDGRGQGRHAGRVCAHDGGDGRRGAVGLRQGLTVSWVGDRAGRWVPVRVGAEEAFGQSRVLMVDCGAFTRRR